MMEVRQRKNAQRQRNISSSSSPDNGGSDDSYNNEKKTYNKSTSSILKNSKYDEYSWFIIFLTALTYFIYTRGGNNTRGGLLSSFSKPYTVISSSISVGSDNQNENEKLLKSIFYVANTQHDNIQHQYGGEKALTLEYNSRLEVILSSPLDTHIFHGDDKECISSNTDDNDQQQQSAIPYLSHLSSTTWVHDEELGRGYLLLADVGRSGRIWRWEVGGGPITIGRSLHMERSGCRSGLWISDGSDNVSSSCPENLFGDSKSCVQSSSTTSLITSKLLGSASLAVELTRNADRASAGQNIIVAEWGERRIVRVEHESGARTPLVTVVPTSTQGSGEKRRVYQPNHLMYTPFGDLLFSDNFELDDDATNNSATTTIPIHVGAVYRKKEAVHIPAIPVEESRNAHSWIGTTPDNSDDDKSIDILFQTYSGVIEGMALGLDYSTLYVLVTIEDSPSSWMKTVYKLSLSTDDEDDEDEDSEVATRSVAKKGGVTVLYQMSSTECKEANTSSSTTSGSKLAVDEKGTIYIITCPTTLTLLQESGSVVGTLDLDHLLQKNSEEPQQAVTMPFTSVSFGEDGYLYITSANKLMRVKSRIGGLSLPTNMVVPPPLKKK